MKIITKPETEFRPCDACRIADHSTMIKVEGDGRGGYQDIFLCLSCAQEAGALAEEVRERGNVG
ncbi:MAG: hypothetical protein KDK05_30430 [Candidatus Competibacteraceae bacterium]|nr:hypothetical protein [Candidatus Competibacteraceae bacterium]